MAEDRIDKEMRDTVMQSLLHSKDIKEEVIQLQPVVEKKVQEQKSNSNYCSNCGQQLNSNFKYCPGCGTGISEQKKSVVEENQTSSLSMLEQVINNKQEKEEERDISEEGRRSILSKGINENIIEGMIR